MPLQKILKTIEDESQKNINEIRKANEEKMEKLAAEYNNEVYKQETMILEKIKKEIKTRIEKTKFLLNMEENKILLEKKWKLINDVYSEALKKLSSKNEKEKKNLFFAWLKNCPAEGEIIAAESDIHILQKMSAGNKILKDSLNAKGGFIFKSEKMIIDFTFENLIDQIRNETEIEVGKILFGP